jgi:hypothetical protein
MIYYRLFTNYKYPCQRRPETEHEDQGIVDTGHDGGNTMAKENESEPLKGVIKSDQAVDSKAAKELSWVPENEEDRQKDERVTTDAAKTSRSKSTASKKQRR